MHLNCPHECTSRPGTTLGGSAGKATYNIRDTSFRHEPGREVLVTARGEQFSAPKTIFLISFVSKTIIRDAHHHVHFCQSCPQTQLPQLSASPPSSPPLPFSVFSTHSTGERERRERGNERRRKSATHLEPGVPELLFSVSG